MSTRYDVLGIGNAIVDVLAQCDEAFLAQHQLVKGSMTLIDEVRAEALYHEMGVSTECSGGSAANTLAGLASLGAKCAFIGKVRDDQLGAIFRHDLKAAGVEFDTPAALKGPTTARCMIFVTPDAQRTMCTFLGACTEVGENDIDELLIAGAGMLYIEGYLWDQVDAKQAIRKAITCARQYERSIAMTLSDTFCVERHRPEFLHLLRNELDVLFANEAELKALTQERDFDAAVAKVRGECEVIVITRSEKGSVVVTRDEIIPAAAESVARVVDTTGAGDLFAAGFLFGLSRGWDLASCAQLGNRCAGEIIKHFGARSMKPLHTLVA